MRSNQLTNEYNSVELKWAIETFSEEYQRFYNQDWWDSYSFWNQEEKKNYELEDHMRYKKLSTD